MICISAIAIANMISLEMDMPWVVLTIERNSQETYSMWLLPNTIRQINDLVTLPSLSNTGADDPRSKSARLHIPMPNTLRLTMCAHSQLSILRLSSWTFTKELHTKLTSGKSFYESHQNNGKDRRPLQRNYGQRETWQSRNHRGSQQRDITTEQAIRDPWQSHFSGLGKIPYWLRWCFRC